MNENAVVIKDVRYIDIDDKYFPVRETSINNKIDLTGRHVDIYTIAIDGKTGEEYKVKISVKGHDGVTFSTVDDEEWNRRFYVTIK